MATGPRYNVEFNRLSFKQLEALPQEQQARILDAITALGDEPRPRGSKKLKGSDDYRIRIGRYRVIYSIEDDRLVVLMLWIGHRKDAYRHKP